MKKLMTMMMLGASVVSYSKEKIVVYTPSSMSWNNIIAEDFKNKTGIEVEFVGIEGIVGRMKLEKKRPKADVVIGLTQSNLLTAKKEGLVAKYKPSNADLIKNEALIIDKEWYATSFDYGLLGINTNKGLIDMPTSFEDITKLNKKVIVPSPNSFTGQEFMLWTLAVYGENWKEFWTELKPSIKTVTGDWSDAWAKFTTNEAPLMVGYATSDLYFEEGSDYESFIPSEGGYVYLEGASLIKKKEIKDEAKVFMEYILEDNYQKMMAEHNYMLPVTELELGSEYDRIPSSANLMKAKPEHLENVEKYKKELIKLLRK